MSLLDGASLVREIVEAVEAHPDLAQRLQAILASPAASPPLEFQHVGAYAKARGYSERTGWKLVSEGLPTIGEGKRRRVDVAQADAWLRNRDAAPRADKVEVLARRAAMRALDRE